MPLMQHRNLLAADQILVLYQWRFRSIVAVC